MSQSATQLFEWESTDGSRKSLIFVKDYSVDEGDIARERFEIAKYDESNSNWKTDETLDYIDEVLSYGIPEDFVD